MMHTGRMGFVQSTEFHSGPARTLNRHRSGERFMGQDYMPRPGP